MKFVLILNINLINEPCGTFIKPKSSLSGSIASFVDFNSSICHSRIILQCASSNMVRTYKFFYYEKQKLSILNMCSVYVDFVKQACNDELIIRSLLAAFPKRASYFLYVRNGTINKSCHELARIFKAEAITFTLSHFCAPCRGSSSRANISVEGE